MVRILNGKRYDTERAQLVASWDNGLYSSDFRNCSEQLYLTPKGTWFLYGAGGPMSSYSQSCGDMTGGGEAIIPYTAARAQAWLEMHGKHRVLEQYFSESIVDA